MNQRALALKRNEWLKRYIPAELLGKSCALLAAWSVYAHNHSYVAAAGSGLIGEGIGFYGYFITVELSAARKQATQHTVWKRLTFAAIMASTNLLVECLPAELLDNLLFRPVAMYAVPRVIHPYPVGFLAGKFSADLLFYILAITGYELRKYWFRS